MYACWVLNKRGAMDTTTTNDPSSPSAGNVGDASCNAPDRAADSLTTSSGDGARSGEFVDVANSGATETSAEVAPSSGWTGRWCLAVVIGALVSLPIAWLLSYAATLPFFLGPFFFALFGLLIGAIMHRIASPRRPYRSGVLVVGTTFVVALMLGVSIVNESRDLPQEIAEKVSRQNRTLGGRSIDEFHADVADDVRRFLRESYAPGGAIGYVRWVLTRGELAPGDIEGIHRTVLPRQRRFVWAARVVLSIALLGFGLGSQTLALRLNTDPIVRQIDRKKHDVQA